MFTVSAVNVRRTLLDFSKTNGMDIREKMSHKFGFLDFLLSEDGHVCPLRRDVLAMRRCGWS